MKNQNFAITINNVITAKGNKSQMLKMVRQSKASGVPAKLVFTPRAVGYNF